MDTNRIIWLHPKNERYGPTTTDYNGELKHPVKVCWGCKHLGIHDQHYPYCSAQYAQNQDATATYTYPWKGAGKYIAREKPDNGCPYIEDKS